MCIPSPASIPCWRQSVEPKKRVLGARLEGCCTYLNLSFQYLCLRLVHFVDLAVAAALFLLNKVETQKEKKSFVSFRVDFRKDLTSIFFLRKPATVVAESIFWPPCNCSCTCSCGCERDATVKSFPSCSCEARSCRNQWRSSSLHPSRQMAMQYRAWRLWPLEGCRVTSGACNS